MFKQLNVKSKNETFAAIAESYHNNLTIQNNQTIKVVSPSKVEHSIEILSVYSSAY